MRDGESRSPRRRFLRLTGSGSVIAFAGCLSTENETESRDDRPEDWCLEELDETVPEEERSAVSIDGIERKGEDELLSKADAAYQCGPEEGNHCGTCTFYIDDRNGDAIGACTEVEGEIRSVDWCALWAPREKIQSD